MNMGFQLRYQGVQNLDLKIGTHNVKATKGAIDAVTTPVTTPGQTATATTDTRITAASAAYKMGDLRAELIHGRNQTMQANAQISKVTANMIGVDYTMGNIRPFAKYGMGGTETGISGAANADTKGYQLGTQYLMSKRTSLYAAYGFQEIKVKTSTTANLINNSTKRVEIAAGVLHTF
jgi:predicted porin